MARPRIITYNLASVDGRLTVAPDALLVRGDERWTAAVGSCPDPYRWLLERYRPQAFLEGSGSFTLEGQLPPPLPEPSGDVASLLQDFLPDSIAAHAGRRGWFVAVDGRGRVRWTIKEWPDEAFRGWHLLVLVHALTPPAYLGWLREQGIPYVVAGEGSVDLALAFEKMAERLGIRTVISTAGGRLNGALARGRLVDEVIVEFFPAIVGGLSTPSLFDAPDLGPGQEPMRLRLVDCQKLGSGHVRLRYAVASS